MSWGQLSVYIYVSGGHNYSRVRQAGHTVPERLPSLELRNVKVILPRAVAKDISLINFTYLKVW